LADRLRAIAPTGLEVEVREEGLVVFRLVGTYPGGTDVATATSEPTIDPAEAIQIAAWNALNDFQDYLSEASTEPWPSVKGLDGRWEIANPQTETSDGKVRMWFGERQKPVLRVADLDVVEFVLE
jgi:hypothetical protein